MRLMSFALTTEQVYAGTKSVTRRKGWRFIKPGDIVQGVEKAQGLKKGEHPVKIRLIRIISTRWERLDAITPEDVKREGFPGKTPEWFIEMYCAHNGGDGSQMCNRIEFEYLRGNENG